MHILYVEDNLLVREVTLELLAQDGRNFTALGSAEEALEEFKARPSDVVITDVSLPSMSGIELARNLLKIDPKLPIIIASGYALDFGMHDFGPSVRSIIKPFDADDIDALIDEITRARI
ncbi:MAG TPA: response regulator [Steroidobacteraceae bacterium]|jgi:CheY-like chemotaxis protein